MTEDANFESPDGFSGLDSGREGVFERTLTDDEIEDLVGVEDSPVTVTFSTQDYPIDGLVKRLERGSMLIPQFGRSDDRLQTPGFQRGFVWSKAQMDRFVESLLLGYPVPGIFLVKQTEDNRLLVLDGQQRLETLRRFYEGIHGGREFSLQNVGTVLRGKTYKTLDEPDRIKLDDSYLQATIVISDGSLQINDAIYQIFERLNSGGTQLTPHEIRVALYAGPLVDFIETCNADRAWRSLFGPPSKRIRDHELISRILALYQDADSYMRPLKHFLNRFFADHRDMRGVDPTIERLFIRACAKLAGEVGPEAFRSAAGNQVNAAQAEAVTVGMMRALTAGAEVNDLPGRIHHLRTDAEFVRWTTRATADKDAVTERLRLATEALS